MNRLLIVNIELSVFDECTLYNIQHFTAVKICQKSYRYPGGIYIQNHYGVRSLKEGFRGLYRRRCVCIVYIHYMYTYLNRETPKKERKNRRKKNNRKYKANRSSRATGSLNDYISGCVASCWQIEPKSMAFWGLRPATPSDAKTL